MKNLKIVIVALMATATAFSSVAAEEEKKEVKLNDGVLFGGISVRSQEFNTEVVRTVGNASPQNLKEDHNMDAKVFSLGYEFDSQLGQVDFYGTRSFDADADYSIEVGNTSKCDTVCKKMSAKFFEFGGGVKVEKTELLGAVPGRLDLGTQFSYSEWETGSFSSQDINYNSGFDLSKFKLEATAEYTHWFNRKARGFIKAQSGYSYSEVSKSGTDVAITTLTDSTKVERKTLTYGFSAGFDFNAMEDLTLGVSAGVSGDAYEFNADATCNVAGFNGTKCSVKDVDAISYYAGINAAYKF